jgi:4-amino-4-deoxy-L-arabinose transferase-like glycosyltransferase
MKWKSFLNNVFKKDMAILVVLSLVKLVIHFIASGQYGYFRDELYYMACGENLDFGYVDHPPLIAIITRFSRMLLGDSLFAIRFFPAVAGALVIFLTGLIVRELGGKRSAIILAAVAVLIAPIFLGIDSILSMNAFDHLFWTLAAFILILILKNKNDKLWLVLGAVLGLGLQNKHSIFFFGFGLLVGLFLTQHRKYHFSPSSHLAVHQWLAQHRIHQERQSVQKSAPLAIGISLRTGH